MMSKRPKLHQRFHWLFYILVFRIQIGSALSRWDWDGIIITEADYQGLQAFKHALDDPNGVLRSWNGTGLNACSGSWLGIKCVKGKVIAIQLPWRGLGGRITEKIGQLTALRKLNLHDNAIGGQVPPALGFLADLRGLYLFNNRFSGTIPPSIGNCLLLQAIDLSNNLLVGSIPSSISNSNRLYRLNLSYNNLSGPIPADISRSPSLTYLSLQYNNLSGTVPDTWGELKSGVNATYRLKTMYLDHNSLSGSIPASISRLQMLEEVSLSNNRLNGSIPEGFGRLLRLRELDFSHNLIQGSFPDSLCNLSSLIRLSLEDNRLDSSIPEAIDGLRNLSVLSLKRNQFNGDIPATLGNITILSQLDLSENNFSGGIPVSLSQLTSLTSFNVSNNNLSGPVPPVLSQKFNSSSFRGNIQLCGYSSLVPCPSAPSPSLPSPSAPTKPGGRRLSTRDIILIAAGGVIALLLVLCCLVLCCLARKRNTLSKKSAAAAAAARGEKPGPAVGTEVELGGEAGGKLVHFDGPLVFTADDLLCATAEIMGKSTYGTVYKATLEDGSEVAVKRLREKITKSQKEFETEVNMLGKIRHPNLLALRAYYLGPKGEKLLVFDFMPKGSLAAYLHARGLETLIDWPTRMNIAMGLARGLQYLHADLDMVHGNLTSSNVLLDENINAKISDFGLYHLATTAASSNVMATVGALGYRAPELSKLKKVNKKTDVYSLGVIMLELLTGKSPGDAMNGMDLPQWVASSVKEEWTNEVFDLELMRETEGTTGDELLNTLKLALHCVDPSPAARPEIEQVLQQLEEIKPELAGSAGTYGEGSGGSAGPATSTE